MVDPRSNILFVQDTAARLEEVRKIIRQIDTSIRQVMIEARIVIASDKFSRQLGVRFGAQTGATFNRRYSLGQGGSLSTQPVVTCSGTSCIRETRTQTPYELASGIANAGYSDYLYAPRMRKVIEWFATISTPCDSRTGGFRHQPAIGQDRHDQDRTGVHDVLARGLAAIGNPCHAKIT